MELVAPTLIVVLACGLVAYFPPLIWRFILKRSTGPGFREYSGMAFSLAGGFGFLGFLLGFFGPMLLWPGSAQGPMLGIFITGPLGAVIGLLATWAWFYAKRTNT